MKQTTSPVKSTEEKVPAPAPAVQNTPFDSKTAVKSEFPIDRLRGAHSLDSDGIRNVVLNNMVSFLDAVCEKVDIKGNSQRWQSMSRHFDTYLNVWLDDVQSVLIIEDKVQRSREKSAAAKQKNFASTGTRKYGKERG